MFGKVCGNLVMRFENWPKLLDKALKKAGETDFSWGEYDCLYWPNYVVEDITGENPGKAFFSKFPGLLEKRQYMTTKGMERTMKNLGFDNFESMLMEIYGKPINPKKAQRGDLVMVQLPGVFMPTLGICRGIDSMFKTREGNIFFKTTNCKHAWRVE